MPRVVVADDYNAVYATAPPIAMLRERAEVAIYTTPHRSLDELSERLQGADIIIANRERLPLRAEFFDRVPTLRLIAQTGLRGRHLDLAAATARGILVAGTAGEASGTATAELTVALMLAALRRLPYGDREVRAGQWSQFVGREARGRTLGVIGLGRIGGQVARVAQALGMQVLAWGPTLTPERASAAGATYRPLEALLPAVDVLTIHLRLSELSEGLLDRDKLALLKPDALLVNTSRAAILDETALIALLQAGRLWGAALDVYATEPLPSDHPFLTMPNVVLTPHIGWVAEGSYAEYISGAVANILAYLDGRPLQNVLNSG
ncbi:MAG: D-2-hydroxyacid dehydrogenase family protein [Thermomicrobiales bacterium]